MHRRTFLRGGAAAVGGDVLGEYRLAPTDPRDRSLAADEQDSSKTDTEPSRLDAYRRMRSTETRTTDSSDTDEDSTDESSERGGSGRTKDGAGMVIFTYDDTPTEDYTFTYEIHQEYGVPGCLAACPGPIQEADRTLKPAQLREMHEAGWSVMSHTYYHRALGRIRLTEPAHEGDERLYVEAHRHGKIEGDPLVIFDEETTTSATVSGRGRDSIGAYVALKRPLSDSIGSAGYVRYPEAFMQEILERTDEQLASWGIDVTGFVYPYDRYHGAVEALVRDHYAAVANHRYGGGHNSLDGFDPTTMQRMYIETDKATETGIDEFMKTAANDHVLSIVGGHSQFETLTEDRLRYTIECALKHDLEIVTIDEALVTLTAT